MVFFYLAQLIKLDYHYLHISFHVIVKFKETPHSHCSLKNTWRQTLMDKDSEFSASIPWGMIIPLLQGWANWDLLTKTVLPCVVNKVYWILYIPLHQYINYGYLHAVKIELNSCYRDGWTALDYNSSWFLYKKHLLTFALVQHFPKYFHMTTAKGFVNRWELVKGQIKKHLVEQI